MREGIDTAKGMSAKQSIVTTSLVHDQETFWVMDREAL
jgi:hypothetical protein